MLAGINDVFYRIMTKNLGNICYTEETALHPGAVFPEADGSRDPDGQEKRTAGFPELLVMDTGAEALSGLDEEAADLPPGNWRQS